MDLEQIWKILFPAWQYFKYKILVLKILNLTVEGGRNAILDGIIRWVGFFNGDGSCTSVDIH